MTLKTDVDQLAADAALVHAWAHGSSGTSVTTDGGPVRSPAKLIADLAALVAGDVTSFAFDRVAAVSLYALDRTGVLEKSIDAVRNTQSQTGIAAVSQAASRDLIRTYATAAVTFARPFPDTSYQVSFEVISGAPTASFVGEVQASNKATNGFTLAITGSATAASIRWTVTYPNVK